MDHEAYLDPILAVGFILGLAELQRPKGSPTPLADMAEAIIRRRLVRYESAQIEQAARDILGK